MLFPPLGEVTEGAERVKIATLHSTPGNKEILPNRDV